MKRLITSLVLAVAFVVTSAGTALAEHYWQLDMFRPNGAITGNTFTIEYKVLSVEKNDDFTVKLFQNDAEIATQNTTKDYGDSGVFTVTVPGPGTYQYHVGAQSSIDGSAKTTENRTLTVTSTPSGSTTTVFVNQANATGGGTSGSGSIDGQGGTDGFTAAGGGAGTGGVAGATDSGAGGQVDAEGNSTTDKDGDGVLGADNKDNPGASAASNWPWVLVAALLAALATGYYYVHANGINVQEKWNNFRNKR
jgi:hypothetical protein